MAFFPSLIAFLESSKYVLIFAGSYIEGAGVMMATGLLWHLGTVDFWPAYGALLLGDVLADTMWYFIGFYGGRSFVARFGHWFGVTPAAILKVERRFNLYHTKILLFSKLTMGFGLSIPVLTVAGMMRVPYLRYITINTLGAVIWVLVLMWIGFHFGNILDLIPHDLQIVMTVALPVLAVLFLHALTRRLRSIEW
jgi:membrane protein DedA with SNARE-associated domain